MAKLGLAMKGIPVARLILLGELLLLAREHLHKLEPQERRRIMQLVRRGRGRPRNLTDHERRELARLIEKAEPRMFLGTATRRLVGMRGKKQVEE
jgi:hypothetical protein